MVYFEEKHMPWIINPLVDEKRIQRWCDMHNVSIDRDSKLYNLIKEDKFIVNSIHKCKIDNPGEYKVKGNSEDGIIELLEYEGDNFNIGVQWHPEFITDKEEQNMIFEKFIKYIINKIENK